MEAAIPENDNQDWFVYILRCSNGALYTGVTTDVGRRVAEHDSKGRRSARFTRAFAPVELVYSCCMGAKSPALRAEYRIKRLTRREKALVVAENFSRSKLLNFLDIKE